MDMIELDGADGGGQLLRTALSLSLCTGVGFTMQRIRAGRPRPGLMRQHLTAVRAAAEVGQSTVLGAEPGSQQLRFEPGIPRAGEYTFATGSAGSTTLVLQTVLPALWACNAPSTVRLEGGTHNPMAPSVDFLVHTFLPAVARMGMQADVTLERYGFYPAGGGSLVAAVQPGPGRVPGVFEARGDFVSTHAIALVSNLAGRIGRRELAVLGKRLALADGQLSLVKVEAAGPGNVAMANVRHADHVETVSSYGARGVSAERVAETLADQVQAYLATEAFAGEHLADQLLLPMALAGGGRFTASAVSSHLESNARLIERFLPVQISWQAVDGNAWRISVD